MEKSKLAIAILIIVLLLMLGGCKKTESVDNLKDITASPSPTLTITAAPTITTTIAPSTGPSIAPTIETSTRLTTAPTIAPSTRPTIAPTTMPTVTPIAVPTPSPEELSMDAYEKFMQNKAKISFARFMPENYSEEALYKKGREYTLSEILDIITTHYFKHSKNKRIESIDYSYIDCGMDGVNELVLRFKDMDIYCEDDDSTLVYIIKYIDGKLFLCYDYETWARCDASINEYGYYQSGGSNGASNHGTEYGLIDKEGNWQPIVYIESETDINQLSWSNELGQLPKTAEKKGITDGIELETIRFNYDANSDNSNGAGNKECFYTFYVYDDNWEPIKDANLYTNSIYKEIFKEAKVPFITPDEVSNIISEKEKEVGATAKIKKGAEITWKALSGSLFSDYLGR